MCIAGAIAKKPSLVVLDEPTTGLDVITQDRILKELLRLRDEERVAMLSITHDLAVAAQIADTIAVMYAGEPRRVRTCRPSAARPAPPLHARTHGLNTRSRPRSKLEVMEGIAVGVGERPVGCSFAPRCQQATTLCATEHPALNSEISGRLVRCPEWRHTPPMRWSRESYVTAEGRRGDPLPIVLDVEHLRVEYPGRRGASVAVENVYFQLERSGCVALVGESGSGRPRSLV